MEKIMDCPVCHFEIEAQRDATKMRTFFCCPVCGRFELYDFDNLEQQTGNQLAPYLLYHRFVQTNDIEYRYHTTLDKDTCDKYKKEFNSGNNTNGLLVHMDAEMISMWYPRTFSEKIDLALLYINERIPHIGQQVMFGMQEVFGMLFVDRKEKV